MPNQQDYDPGFKYGNTLVTDDIGAQQVTGSTIATRIGYFSVGTTLSGTNTAEFNVFGSGGLGVASSITAFVASNIEDTLSATNVFLTAGESSVGTVALGGVAGSLSVQGPDAALESATLTAGTKLFLERSIDSIVQVTLTFEVD